MAAKKTPRTRAPRAALTPTPIPPAPVPVEAGQDAVQSVAPASVEVPVAEIVARPAVEPVAPASSVTAPVIPAAPRPVSPDAVRLLARQIWERTHAPALDNWLAAERQLNAAAPSMEAAAHAMNGA